MVFHARTNNQVNTNETRGVTFSCWSFTPCQPAGSPQGEGPARCECGEEGLAGGGREGRV